ncbi:MAG: hypothetical protein Q8P91_02345 [bacterium]|nr:hypothetical protein [bacterium]
MSTFGTFLLAIAAFIGTVMFFANPAVKLERWMRGKKTSELKTVIEDKLENNPGSAILSGCGFVIFVLINFAYTLVVKPLAVITALVNKIGYLPLAYVMLAIVALSWIKASRAFAFNNKKKTVSKGTVMTNLGQKVEGTIVEVDEEIKLGNPFLNTMNRLFFFLPDLYLWYMFLVVIDVLK